MVYFCTLCGLVLATRDSDFPQWCKELRALCLIHSKPILSAEGYIDNNVVPFCFSLPSRGTERFFFRHDVSEVDGAGNVCYPFYSTCWTILQEIDTSSFLNENVEILFNIFESIAFDRNSRSLNWFHNYYLEDISDPFPSREDRQEHRKNLIAAYMTQLTILADPSSFDLSKGGKDLDRDTHVEEPAQSVRGSDCASLPVLWRALLTKSVSQPPHGLYSLPPEVFHLIICYLDICSVKHLWLSDTNASRLYGANIRNLPSSFWESRFCVCGEAGFARSICPDKWSWKDWFFFVESDLKQGVSNSGLRNRKRIWKLGACLVTLMRSIKVPSRGLYGEVTESTLDQMQGPIASCLASKDDSDGGKELKQVYVRLDNDSTGSYISTIVPSYIVFSDRKLISGLTFLLNDGTCIHAGYVTSRPDDLDKAQICPEYLWVVFSPARIETIQVDGHPPELREIFTSYPENMFALAKWPLKGLKGVNLGLDAMRIVRYCFENFSQQNLSHVLWQPPYPSCLPSMEDDDIVFIRELQKRTFVPASTVSIRPYLIVIKIYSPLISQSGITEIRLVYSTGFEQT